MPVSSGIFELLVRRSQTSLAFSEGNPTSTGPERNKTEKKTRLLHWMLLLLYVQVLGLMKDCVYAGMQWGTASSWKICLSNLAQILHPASGERALPKPQHPGVLESGSNGFTKQHRLTEDQVACSGSQLWFQIFNKHLHGLQVSMCFSRWRSTLLPCWSSTSLAGKVALALTQQSCIFMFLPAMSFLFRVLEILLLRTTLTWSDGKSSD